MQKRRHVPKDSNLLARQIVRMATGVAELEPPEPALSPIQEAALDGAEGLREGR